MRWDIMKFFRAWFWKKNIEVFSSLGFEILGFGIFVFLYEKYFVSNFWILLPGRPIA